MDNAKLIKHLTKIIKHCDSKKEPMRKLRIAGPIWRHVATGKSSAYDEVKALLKKLAEELEIDAELGEAFAAAADNPVAFSNE